MGVSSQAFQQLGGFRILPGVMSVLGQDNSPAKNQRREESRHN